MNRSRETGKENGEEKFFCIGVNVNGLNGSRKVVRCFDNEDLKFR